MKAMLQSGLDGLQRRFEIGPPSPVQIAQIRWEFDCLLSLYRARKPKTVLEIGTFCGGSLYHLLQNSTPGTIVVTVDSLVDAPDNRELFDGWCPEDTKCFPIIGDSGAAPTIDEVEAYGPYDFTFIDGLHTYAVAMADWFTYRKMAAPGAVVAFHDIRLRRDYEDGESAGVWRLWREIQEAGYVTQEIVCATGQTEYGIGLIYL